MVEPARRVRVDMGRRQRPKSVAAVVLLHLETYWQSCTSVFPPFLCPILFLKHVLQAGVSEESVNILELQRPPWREAEKPVSLSFAVSQQTVFRVLSCLFVTTSGRLYSHKLSKLCRGIIFYQLYFTKPPLPRWMLCLVWPHTFLKDLTMSQCKVEDQLARKLANSFVGPVSPVYSDVLFQGYIYIYIHKGQNL